MYQIHYTPTAVRSIKTLSAPVRTLCTRLVKAVAELAEIYPAGHQVWTRLGKQQRGMLEVDVARKAVRIAVDPRERAIRVIAVAKPVIAAAKSRPRARA